MVLFAFLSTLSIISATLKGKVIDVQTEQPIALAAVEILNSKIGTYTDSLGYFLIIDIPQKEITIVASHIGFLSDTIKYNPVQDIDSSLIFRLQPEAIPQPIVEVYSKPPLISRTEPSHTLEPSEIRKVPGNFGDDVLRSIAYIPGGGMSGDVWSGPPVIRNAATDENLIYYDGVELPWAWHLAGFNSIISTDFIDQSKVYISAIPIRYDALSGVTLISSKKVKKSGGSFAYDAIGLRGAAWYKFKQFDIGASLRKTFYHIKFGPLGRFYQPHFFDFALKSGFDITQSDRLMGGFMKASDDFGDERSEEINLYQTSYSRAGKIGLETNLSYTNHLLTRSSWFFGPQTEYGHKIIFDRTELSWNANKKLNCVLGEEITIEKTSQPEVNNKSTKFTTYGQCAFELLPNFIFNSGLRLGNPTWTQGISLAPRISLNWQVHKTVNLLGGYRDSYQHPFRLLRSSFFHKTYIPIKNILDTLKPGEVILLPKRVQQYSFLVQTKPNLPVDFKFEAYYRRLSNLPLLNSDSNWTSLGFGWSKGIELTALYGSEENLWFEVFYALSETKRLESNFSTICYGEYDRRHALNLRLHRYFRDGWTLIFSFHLATGLPYTPVVKDSMNAFKFGEPNSVRAPIYHRLDMKVIKEAPHLPLSPYVYIEVINLLNGQNPYMLQEYIDSSGEPQTIYYDRVPLVIVAGIGGSF
jgi:hypothetical protein